jgi:hypothetical protein
MPVTTALAGAGFGQSSRLGRYGGLFQRASIITGFAWLTAVSARTLHPGRPEKDLGNFCVLSSPELPQRKNYHDHARPARKRRIPAKAPASGPTHLS